MRRVAPMVALLALELLTGCTQQVAIFIELPCVLTPPGCELGVDPGCRCVNLERAVELREYAEPCPATDLFFEPSELGAPLDLQFIPLGDGASRMGVPIGRVSGPLTLVAFGRDASCQIVSSACVRFDPAAPSSQLRLELTAGGPAPANCTGACSDGVCSDNP